MSQDIINDVKTTTTYNVNSEPYILQIKFENERECKPQYPGNYIAITKADAADAAAL